MIHRGILYKAELAEMFFEQEEEMTVFYSAQSCRQLFFFLKARCLLTHSGFTDNLKK